MARTEQAGPAVHAPAAPGRLPLLGHALPLWRRPIAFLESLREHGDIVRLDIGTWPVHVLTSPDHVHAVLVQQAQQFGRGRIFERLRPMFGNGIVTTDGDFHRKQRRMVQPAFHRNHITEYAEVMGRAAEAMCASWTAGEEVSMLTETRRYALSSVAEMTFSGGLSGQAIAEVHRSLPIVLEGMLLRAVMPKSLDLLPIPPNRKFDAAAARLRRVIDQVIAQYGVEQEDRHDLLSLLLSGVDPDTGAGMSAEQVRDEIIAILFAGTETSATTLAWIFHEIGQHPEVEKRLHEEVDAVVGAGPVRPEDLPRLTYTNNVFQEALRLHSPCSSPGGPSHPSPWAACPSRPGQNWPTAPTPCTGTPHCSVILRPSIRTAGRRTGRSSAGPTGSSRSGPASTSASATRSPCGRS